MLHSGSKVRTLLNSYLQRFLLIGMEVATPVETARTEDPGPSSAREAAEVVPAESVHRNGNQHFQWFEERTETFSLF